MKTRPTLGPHVQVRRHLVGDAARIVVHDDAGERWLVLGEREWRVLSALDGSRDVAGVAIASGVAPEQVAAFVTQLASLGLLAVDAPEPPVEARPARDLPIEPLPGYGFTCDGRGACCATVDGVLFTPLDAARARAAAPEVLDAGHFEDRAFTPASGVDRTLLSVAMCDGGCAYWGADGACRIYDVRPHGCRAHPRRFVDVGDAIRVGPRVACACELTPSDEPLITAARGSDLPPAQWVERLPDVVRLGDEEVSGADALAWLDARSVGDDAFATCDALARELGAGGPCDVGPAIAQAKAEQAWRAPSDRLWRSLEWLAVAAARDAGAPAPDDEALFVRARWFVGAPAVAGDVGRALQAMATQIALARRIPDEARAEPWARHPIVVVNAVARATGLWVQ